MKLRDKICFLIKRFLIVKWIDKPMKPPIPYALVQLKNRKNHQKIGLINMVAPAFHSFAEPDDLVLQNAVEDFSELFQVLIIFSSAREISILT